MMRKTLVAFFAMVLTSLSLVGTAQAQDSVIGTVTADPATVAAAGEHTFTATGSDFIPDTAIIVLKCVSPAAVLVPGQSDLEEIVAAAEAISPLADCDIAAAQNVEVDGEGGWMVELTAEVGDNFFLSAGALDGSQAGATWVAIVPEGAGDTAAEEESAEEEPAEEEAEEEPAEEEEAEEEPAEEEPAEEEPEEEAAEEPAADLADTGVETGLLAVIGTAVLGAGVMAAREARRFRP